MLLRASSCLFEHVVTMRINKGLLFLNLSSDVSFTFLAIPMLTVGTNLKFTSIWKKSKSAQTASDVLQNLGSKVTNQNEGTFLGGWLLLTTVVEFSNLF